MQKSKGTKRPLSGMQPPNFKSHQFPLCRTHNQRLEYLSLSDADKNYNEFLGIFCSQCLRQKPNYSQLDQQNFIYKIRDILQNFYQHLQTKSYQDKNFQSDDIYNSLKYLSQSCLVYSASLKQLHQQLEVLAESYVKEMKSNSLREFHEKAYRSILQIWDTKYSGKIADNLQKLKLLVRVEKDTNTDLEKKLCLVFDQDKYRNMQNQVASSHNIIINQLGKGFKSLQDSVLALKQAVKAKHFGFSSPEEQEIQLQFTNRLNPDIRDQISIYHNGKTVRKSSQTSQHCFVLCQPALNVQQQSVKFSFQIHKQFGWMGLGIVSLSKLKANQYELGSIEQQRLNSFLLDCNGGYYPMVDAFQRGGYNLKTFKFSQGHLITIVVDFISKIIKFFNQTTKDGFNVPARINFQQFADDLYPCVNFYSLNDEVQII